jgi:hypothetical protein
MRLDGRLGGPDIGLACAPSRLACHVLNGEDDDGCQDAEDHDDDQELDEGEAILAFLRFEAAPRDGYEVHRRGFLSWWVW